MVLSVGFDIFIRNMKAWLLRKRYRRTTVILLGCAAFLLGLVVARRSVVIGGLLVALLGVTATAAWKYRSVVTLVAAVCFGLGLGSWRGAAYLHQLQPYQTLALQKVSFTATANVDAVYGKNGQLSFVVRDVAFTYPQTLHVPGTIKVNGFGETMVYRGDKLKISGQLY